jgi:hypothetical protein
MICKPEAVVMGFPVVWADALGTAAGAAITATAAASMVLTRVRREERIVDTFIANDGCL